MPHEALRCRLDEAWQREFAGRIDPSAQASMRNHVLQEVKNFVGQLGFEQGQLTTVSKGIRGYTRKELHHVCLFS